MNYRSAIEKYVLLPRSKKIFEFLNFLLAFSACIFFLNYTISFIEFFSEKIRLYHYVNDLNEDDAFYYFNIARNFSKGAFSTFDGINLTNGYHPLWAFILIPVFSIVEDPIKALYAVKVLEFLLIFGSFVCIILGSTLCRWHFVVLLGFYSMLLTNRTFTCGMEASTVLFFSSLLLLSLSYWQRSAQSKSGIVFVSIVLFLLPWARLEAVSISFTLPVILLFCFKLGIFEKGRSSIIIFAAVAFIGLVVYLAYNYLLFSSPLPISGLAKTNVFSERVFRKEGGFDLIHNFSTIWSIDNYRDGVKDSLVIIGVAVASLIVNHKILKNTASRTWIADVFMTCIALGHIAKFLHSSLFLNSYYAKYEWYFVYRHLINALYWPYIFSVIGCFLYRFEPLIVKVIAVIAVASGGAYLLKNAEYEEPFKKIEKIANRSNWVNAGFQGAQIIDAGLPKGSIIGATDAGVLGYFSKHTVVNLDGLVNSKEYYDAIKNRNVGVRLKKNRITHLANVLPSNKADGVVEMGKRIMSKRLVGSTQLLFEGRTIWGGKKRFKVWAYSQSRQHKAQYENRPINKTMFFQDLIKKAAVRKSNGFEIYVTSNNIIAYRKTDCDFKEIERPFFVYMTPNDKNELPISIRNTNSVVHTYKWSKYGYEEDGVCMAIVPLPCYRLKSLSSGQHKTKDSPGWRVNFKFAN